MMLVPSAVVCFDFFSRHRPLGACTPPASTVECWVDGVLEIRAEDVPAAAEQSFFVIASV